MSLPAGQQRVLEAIEDALRASEPRLASMYATFARLTRNEGQPLREQLPSSRGLSGALGRLWHALSIRRALRAGRRLRRHRQLTRVLILTQLVAALAVLGLLIDVNARVRGTCPTLLGRHAVMTRLPGGACPLQAGRR
jgi:hypothetical protein